MILHTGVSTLQEIRDQSQVGEARRKAIMLAEDCGFGETEAGRVGILVTEAATNILKHAKQGSLIFRPLQGRTDKGVEILAIDSGPGIADTGRSRQDGYSTAGSPGTGLGAMERLSSFFDLYSQPGKGTVVAAQIWAKPQPPSQPPGGILGAVCLPYPGERLCGDGWAVEQSDASLRIIVADGLGHGDQAHEASAAAIESYIASSRGTLETMQMLHGALARTRGAAVAVAELDRDRRILRFAGVGNISGTVLTGLQGRGLASYNGTLGHRILKMQELQYPWPEGGLLIMHSDGINTRWKLDDYPGLRQRHPSLIAGMLYRDAQRGRDDVTMLVVGDAA